MKNLLREETKKINVMLTDEQLEQFVTYYELLLYWNQKMNLTAITERKEVVQKHFVDSLTCLQTGLLTSGSKVIDVGTGAGFPSIPLRIVAPHLNFVLLDSLKKRLIFLEEVVKQLGIEKNITLLHSRAEDAGKDVKYRETFDVAIARAVAPMNILAEFCLPFVKKGGYWIAMKGSQGQEELDNAKKSIQILGGSSASVFSTMIDHHTVISVKKTDITPKKYPRKAGTPSKNPLF